MKQARSIISIAVFALLVMAVVTWLKYREAAVPPERASIRYVGSPEAAARGKEIFFANCIVCHREDAVDRKGLGPPLSGLFSKPASILRDGTELRHTDQAIREFVERGNKNMPPVKSLSAAEINDVLAYLHTL